MEISDLELLARLGLAAVLAALIGIERESRDQPAGLRTHVLVSVGAALFTLVSAYAFTDFRSSGAEGTQTVVDPTRISAQIVTGVGFLGAGAIIRQGLSVRGLTTAAALWISAAVGMASGAGYYLGAVATTLLVLAALIGLRIFREPLMAHVRRDFVVLQLSIRRRERLAEAITLLAEHGAHVEGMTMEDEHDGVSSYHLELRVPPEADLQSALRALCDLDGVTSVSAEGLRLSFEWRSPPPG